MGQLSGLIMGLWRLRYKVSVALYVIRQEVIGNFIQGMPRKALA